MSFIEMRFKGNSLEKQVCMNVLVPEQPGPFPVLYLLHGLSDDHTIWMRRTSIERHAAGMPLIIVMPDGGRSWYCNDLRPGGLRYEDHIVRDVAGVVDATFSTIPRRSSRAIAGLSMGGYGATMLAMRHPDVFSVAAGHSGVMRLFHAPYPKWQSYIDSIAACHPAGTYDLFKLAKKNKVARQKLALRFDCGTEDELIGDNRDFHAYLTRLGFPHEYQEHPGAHTWDYWDLHIRETLAFVMKHLSRKTSR
jgi:S-formylglutathione hydrolase FrmB